MHPSAVDRARKIRLMLFDVDGVLTDGRIWIFPSSAGSPLRGGRLQPVEDLGSQVLSPAHMIEAKGFSAHDGIGISLARLGGIKCGIVTKRTSEAVADRARALRLEYAYMGQTHKMQAVREIMRKESLMLEQIAYAGDDIVDLPVMRLCGLAIAVENARVQVKNAAHYITSHRGGDGAGRDAIEFVLESQGILNDCVERYIDERNANPGFIDISQGGT